MKCLICKSEKVCRHILTARIFIGVLIGILAIVLVYTFFLKSNYTTPAPPEILPTWGSPLQITTGIEINSVQFLPDGRLFFVGDDGILMANADGSDMRTLFYYEGIRRANMSPDGRKIVLDNDFDIFIANPDGSELKSIVHDPDIFEFAISFTPDGEAITFVTLDDAHATYGIWIMDPDGSNKSNLLVSNEDIFRHPRQSPDGKRMSYFTTGKGKKPVIWVMSKDGTDSVALTNPDVDGTSRQASWNSSSAQFVYSSNKSGDFDIWTMHTDGSSKKRITNIPGDEAKPVWSPDGESIAFVCSDCFGTTGSDLYLVSKE